MKNILKNLTISLILLIGFAFFALSNQIGGWRLFIVSSGSMEPAIHTGSLILSKYQHPSKLQNHDIITFIPPTKQREFVTHRITDINNKNSVTTIRTKGDANKNKDTWILAGGAVIGKVIFTLPYVGYFLSFTQTKIGIALFILLPTIFLIINELTYIKELINQHRKRKIPIQEVVTIFFIFFTTFFLLPNNTYALLADTTYLINNSFTVECGDDTSITISGNDVGSKSVVSVKNETYKHTNNVKEQ